MYKQHTIFILTNIEQQRRKKQQIQTKGKKEREIR